MSEVKHYNIFALQGDTQTTDQDVCDTLGLDPSLANTPAINEAAIKKMHRQNYEGYISKGMSEDKAMALADAKANETKQIIRMLMKQE